jgi:phage gp46-like protein
MSDIRTTFTNFAGDWLVSGSRLAQDDGLETAVIISLFTDRRAKPSDKLPSAGDDRRGWWGDTFPAVRGDRIGSRLWLLHRSKQLPEVVALTRDYARECLQWLIDDGIARRITVKAEVVRTGVLGLGIEIARSNKAVAQYRFETFWKGQ